MEETEEDDLLTDPYFYIWLTSAIMEKLIVESVTWHQSSVPAFFMTLADEKLVDLSIISRGMNQK